MYWLLTIPVAILSHKLVSRYFDKIKKWSVMTGWNVLQICSYLEIKAISTYKCIRSFFPQKPFQFKSTITFVKNGDETDVFEIDDFLCLKTHNELFDIRYDFILYEIPIENNDKYTKHVIRYNNYEQIAKVEYTATNDFKLNVIQFSFKDSPEHVTSINFNDTNFYSSDNILFDRDFLKWYMKKYHSIIIIDDDKYNISFIDHNMSFININETSFIVIRNNDYKVINSVSNDALAEETFTLL
jgi:hypothetical protein